MRRGGYLASLSGARAARAAQVLRPPRRLFAPEPPPLDRDAPPPGLPASPVEQEPSAARRPVQPRAGVPEPAPSADVELPRLEPPALATVVAPPPEPPEHGEPPGAVPVEAERLETVEGVAADPAPTTAAQSPDAPRASQRQPARAVPVARVESRRSAVQHRPSSTRRDRTPGLRIGTIEVTVLPPPSPFPQPPAQSRPAAVHRPRPVRGPERPEPWFGLAQR